MKTMTFIVNQALLANQKRTELPHKFNPRPQGVIVKDSATDLVLAYLRSDPRYKTRCEVIRAIAKSAPAVDWALIFLRAQGLVFWVPDGRNSRYGRYKAKLQGEINE